jgi:hypothetical protein
VLPSPPSETEESESESESESASLPLDEDRLGLRRREVGYSTTPTMGPAVGDLTEGEMSDLEDNIDIGRVPHDGTILVDALMAAKVPVPVWALVVLVLALSAYLCLLIGTGILAVRRPH